MPNTNHAAGMTRSQTPVFPESIWSYYLASGDRGVLHRAYPLLEAEYNDYWNAEHHRTPIGLATNRDLGDSNLPPAYAAEAETLDWTPIFGGDVRRCVPLMTNCALVRYARTVASIAAELGDDANADAYEDRARERAALINRYCWNESRGLFLEYDFVADEQLAYLSLCAYWPLWAGVASPHQAQRLVENLSLFERPNGLSSTDKAYDDPHESPLREEYDLSAFEVIAGGGEPLQWMYPAGWAPEHLIVVDGLWAYGYESEAQRVAERFLGLMLEQHRLTGRLWEKYNVADGTLELPNSRCGNIPMRGWTAAAVVLLGRRLWVGPY
jgi:alpha,alpha-trehalase